MRLESENDYQMKEVRYVEMDFNALCAFSKDAGEYVFMLDFTQWYALAERYLIRVHYIYDMDTGKIQAKETHIGLGYGLKICTQECNQGQVNISQSANFVLR